MFPTPVLSDFPFPATIHLGNAVVQGRSRVTFNGEVRKHMNMLDEAGLLIGENYHLPHLPAPVYRAIVSLIRLRISRMIIQDSASVRFGLLAKEVETLTEINGQPRPFLLSNNGAKISLLEMFRETAKG